MEVSLSFDNAVINAGILKKMNAFWQKIFLTIGVLIAVFGMRLVFPVVIVAVSAKLGKIDMLSVCIALIVLLVSATTFATRTHQYGGVHADKAETVLIAGIAGL